MIEKHDILFGITLLILCSSMIFDIAIKNIYLSCGIFIGGIIFGIISIILTREKEGKNVTSGTEPESNTNSN